jgi:hypothetical protein
MAHGGEVVEGQSLSSGGRSGSLPARPSLSDHQTLIFFFFFSFAGKTKRTLLPLP